MIEKGFTILVGEAKRAAGKAVQRYLTCWFVRPFACPS